MDQPLAQKLETSFSHTTISRVRDHNQNRIGPWFNRKTRRDVLRRYRAGLRLNKLSNSQGDFEYDKDHNTIYRWYRGERLRCILQEEIPDLVFREHLRLHKDRQHAPLLKTKGPRRELARRFWGLTQRDVIDIFAHYFVCHPSTHDTWPTGMMDDNLKNDSTPAPARFPSISEPSHEEETTGELSNPGSAVGDTIDTTFQPSPTPSLPLGRVPTPEPSAIVDDRRHTRRLRGAR